MELICNSFPDLVPTNSYCRSVPIRQSNRTNTRTQIVSLAFGVEYKTPGSETTILASLGPLSSKVIYVSKKT